MPNFPGSLDSFTNPTGTTPLAGAGGLLHSLEHATHQDILLALETKLGQNPASTDSLGYVYTGDGTNKGLWVPSGAVLSPGLLLNSNFDVWQKGGASVSVPTTQNTTTSYTADRFFVLPAGASVTVTLNTNPPPNNRSQSTMSLTGAASVTTVDIGQRVRSRIVLNQAKQSLVFSCYIFNNTGSAFTPNLRIGTPAAVDNFATVTNRLNQALQSCASGGWTRVFFVFDPSAYTNINNGMEVVLRIPSGALSSVVTVLLGQFDLRPGNHLMEYYPPSAYLEFLQCREYLQVLGGSNSAEPYATGHWNSVTAASLFLPLQSSMRASPALVVSASGDFDLMSQVGAGLQVTSGPTVIGAGGTQGFLITASVASGGVTGNGTELINHGTNAGRIYAIAEF